MATVKSLEIAVGINNSSANRSLDNLANKLDSIHRKAQQLRQNKINFDVDGDSESIARAEAVDSAVDDVDDSATIDFRTSGGYDTTNALSRIYNRAGELQGRFNQLGNQFDIDESRFNEPLERARETIDGTDVEDLSRGDIREIDPHLTEAKSAAAEVGAEMFFDTSDFQQKVGDFQDDLYEAVTETEQQGLQADYGDPEPFSVESDLADIRGELTDVSEDVSRDVGVSTNVDVDEDVRSVVGDVSEAIDSDDISRAIERVSDLQDHLDDLDADVPALEQRVDTFSQYLERDDVDDDVLSDQFQSIEREIGIDTSFDDDINRDALDKRLGDRSELIERLVNVDTSIDDDINRDVLDKRFDDRSEIIDRLIEVDTSVTDDLDRDAFVDQIGELDPLERSIDTDISFDEDVDDPLSGDSISDRVDGLDPIRREVDVETSFDEEVFSDRLHDLGREVSENEGFLRRMGVDPEATYDELGALHERVQSDISSGDLDTDSVREYRDQFAVLNDELLEASRISKQFRDSITEIDNIGDIDVNEVISGDREDVRTDIQRADQQLQDLYVQTVQRLDPDTRFDEEGRITETEVELESNDVTSRIMGMRAALSALDDSVANPEAHLDVDRDEIDWDSDQRRQISDQYDGFLEAARREGSLLERQLGDVGDGFQTDLSEASFRGQSDIFQDRIVQEEARPLTRVVSEEYGSFDRSMSWDMFGDDDTERNVPTDRLMGNDRGSPDSLRRRAADAFIGPENIAQFRGERDFSREDFIDPERSVGELIDPDSDVSIDEIFDFGDRELEDVFESEQSFRAYLNPDSDVDLGDAKRGDRDFGDISLESRGIRKRMEGLAGIDMNSFYDAFAKTIPLLGVFVGAIPAAVTGLLTLGGAAIAAAGTLAAVGGLSIAGLAYQLGGGDIQAGIEEIRSRLTTQAEQSFAPLMDRFDDLGADGLRGLEKFIDRIAEESVALTSLKDEARDFGEWVFNVVPEAIDDVVALTEAFAPLFGMGASWLTNTDILGGFVETTDDVLPSILTIIDAFLQILPVVVQFSEGMLMVTAAVFEFWSVVWGAIDALGPFATGLGIAVGALLALYTHLTIAGFAMNALSTITASRATPSIMGYVASTQLAAWASALFNTAIMRLAGTSLVKFIASMLGSIPVIGSYITSMGIATAATYALAAAIAATGIGLLLVGLGTLGGAFLSTGGKIDEATKSLEDFKSARDGLGGGPGIDNPYGPLPSDAQTSVNGSGSGSSDDSGGDTVVDNSTTNVEVNTNGSRKDSMNAQRDLDHALFRKNETSSSPY